LVNLDEGAVDKIDPGKGMGDMPIPFPAGYPLASKRREIGKIVSLQAHSGGLSCSFNFNCCAFIGDAVIFLI